MKKFVGALIVLLMVLGCASTRIDRATFMERGNAFDAKYKSHPEYRECFKEYMGYLWRECKPIADKYAGTDEEWKFWTCANSALDEMEKCVNR